MKKGFTLIEVMVVAVIVAILSAVAIPAYNGYISKAKSDVAKNTAGTIAAQISAYYAQNPSTYNPATTTPVSTVTVGTSEVKCPDDYELFAITGTTVTVRHTADTDCSGSVDWK